MEIKFTLKERIFLRENLDGQVLSHGRVFHLPVFILLAFAMIVGVSTAWGQTDPCAKTYNVCSGGSVVLTHDASCGNGGSYFWAAIESDGNYFYNGEYTPPTLTYSTGNFGSTGGIGGGWGDGENPAHVGATDENRCHYPGSMTVDIKNSNSNDPYIYFPIPEGADPNIYRYFIIRYRVNYKSTADDLGNMELFFFNDNHTDVAHPNNSYRLLNRHVVTNGDLGQLYPKCSTNGYTEVVVDTWDANGNWKTGGKITGLRLDPISYNTNNNKQVHMSIDYIGLVTIVPPSTDNTYTMENVTANTTMNSYQINMNGSVPVTQQANSSTHMHNAAGVIYYGWTSTRSTHTVQVYAALNAGAIATGEVSRCEGDNTAVSEIGEATAASHEAGATLSYKWYVSKDDGTPSVIADATGNTYTPDISSYSNTPGTYVFTREVISDLCDASPKFSEGSFTLTVKNCVTMNDITTYTATACSGTDVTATFTSDIDGVSYSWSQNNANVTPASGSVGIDGAFSQAFTNSTNTAQTVTFSVTPTKGGVNGPAKTFEVTINPTPNVAVNASATCICLGGTATFSATEGFSSYSWSTGSTNAGMPSATNTSSITVTPTGAGDMSYTVTVVDANGCTNTASASLVVKDLPTISANPNTQNITYGDDITPVQITAPAGATVTTSTLPDGLTYASSAISGKPTNVGSYTITATATVEDCTASTPITINVGKKDLIVTYTGTDAANTKVYDGTPLTLSYDKLTFAGLESGDAFTAGVITTDGYKVGSYVCNAGSFERMMADGVAVPSGFAPASVTSKYNVRFNVTLTITPRPLEITANSATKPYDATPLTNSGWTYTNGTSLASTDEADVTVVGEQLCPGSSENKVTDVTITHTGDNEVVTDCYTITKKTGTLTVSPLACESSIDYQGYTYPLVQIGDQCWFAENLRAEIGDAVPYKEESDNLDKFGMLYHWTDALNGNSTKETDPCNGDYVQGACPQGWAIPSAADFNALQAYAHGMAGIRSDNPQYWLVPYLGDNTTGFDERGGGLFNSATARFEELMSAAYFWTSESILNPDAYTAGTALAYVDEYYCSEFIHKVLPQDSKLSVRCVRKTVSDIPATSFTLEVNGPDKETFCAGSDNAVSATYTAVLDPAIATATYQWYVNGSPVSGAQSATYTKSYTSADAGTAVIKCEVTADGTTKDGSVSTQVVVLDPYLSENTLEICDCLLPYTYSKDGWNETWTAEDLASGVESRITRTRTLTTAAGCDSVLKLTLKTWSASSETPTTCTGVVNYRPNETGNGSGLETVSDFDGNVYHVVQIGNQCWMKENLRVKHFADGRALSPAYSVSEGNKANIYYATTGNIYSKGPCDGDLTFQQHTERYGLMYNWYTAMDNANPAFGLQNVQGICPDGWHLPDTAEWQTLERSAGFYGQHSETEHVFVGTSAIQLVTGCEWKESTVAGTPGDYSAMGRNATNFSVRPAGCFLDVAHDVDGTHYNADQFAYTGIWAFFWSSTRFKHPSYPDSGAAYNYDITFDKAGIARDVNYRDYLIGRSVRCIRNN